MTTLMHGSEREKRRVRRKRERPREKPARNGGKSETDRLIQKRKQ